MEVFSNLQLGLSVSFTVTNLLLAFSGCLIGTLIGVLPGLGAMATLAMLLPITYYLEPSSAMIMLAAIYYGSQYGGSTTAILLNIPGENASVITCLDGHPMARKGRAGAALAVAALGSLFAGCVATIIIAMFAPPLARFAGQFGPGDYFALMLFGLVSCMVLSQGSLLKSLGMALTGLLLGCVGADLTTGLPRYGFGIPELRDGIGFIPLAMGLFGIAEVIRNLQDNRDRQVTIHEIGSLYPTREELKAAGPAIVRGTAAGSILGLIPGGGALMGTFASYVLEKKLSKTPEAFGHGAIQGVAGPESANNAGAQTSFIPMLTLGIPPTPILALLMGVMIIHGISPGPSVISSHPDLFWGVVVSMWIANVILVILNLPLIGIWVQLLKVPYRILVPIIVYFCIIGSYSDNYSSVSIMIMAIFGLVGYLLSRIGCESAPAIIAFILGPLMEDNFRRSLLMSQGSFEIFTDSVTSIILLSMAVIVLGVGLLPFFKTRQREIFTE